MKTLICCADLSDALRIDEAIAVISEKDREAAVIICLDREAEYELERRNIVFTSIMEYARTSRAFVASAEWTESLFYTNPVMSFSYEGANLAEAFTYSFQHYIERVLYFTEGFAALVEAEPEVSKLILFSQRSAPISVAFSEGRENEAYFDAAQAVAASHHLEVEILRAPEPPARVSFMLKRALFQFFLVVWNICMTVVRRQTRPRFLASDYWRNISPALENLGTGELVLLDREQFFKIPWRSLFAFRVRFIHIEQFENAILRARATDAGAQFSSRFEDRGDVLDKLSFSNIPLGATVQAAFEGIIAAVPKVVLKFEASLRMFNRYRTEFLLLRASASRQTHFSVLALAARKLGIPSLELQHGLEYFGPGSLSTRRSAEYIGIYGPLVREEMLASGYAPERLIDAGSPRFDLHQVMPEDESEFRIVCIAPAVFAPFTSYALEKYFAAVVRACTNVPRAHVVIKLRPGKGGEPFIRSAIERTFRDTRYTIAQYEPLEQVLAGASASISPFSTSVLESMLCGVSTIAFAADEADGKMISFHFTTYEREKTLMIAFDEAALERALTALAASPDVRRAMVMRAQRFLSEKLLLDGKASERIADFIRQKTSRAPRL